MLKIVAGLAAGLIVALAAIYVIWLVGLQVYPLPPESGLESLESEGALIQSMPTGALLFIAVAWFGGAFIGALTAAHISRRLWPGWVIAFLVACVSISNIIMFPHPEWMQLAAIIVPVLGGLLATHWARRNLHRPMIANA
ncbi:MAG TPA: hypothetical protein VFO69_14150 [Allosphingosinicella sp.]|nr:hypothetical protein [Allosphingosinicella sp.]